MTCHYWPTEDWRGKDPESVGMSREVLTNLDREIKVRFRTIAAFLVVRKGTLVFERYLGGSDPDDVHLVYSVTKSFISALIGIAIDRGYIESVDQRVLDFFPEYAPGPNEQLKRRMTIKHLLTMTAGFQWRTGRRSGARAVHPPYAAEQGLGGVLAGPAGSGTMGRQVSVQQRRLTPALGDH